MTRRIGITTTVPVEVIYAAGHIPVDLNNIFITSDTPDIFLDIAHSDGFAPGVCAWIKGMYGAVISGNIDRVVAVIHGDCANTIALAEVFSLKNIPVHKFAFPHLRDKKLVAKAIEDFRISFGAKKEDVNFWKKRLDKIRIKLVEIDRLTWETGQVTGEENHLFLVSASDFSGDPDFYEKKVDSFLDKAKKRQAGQTDNLRIGIIGVPTIFNDLYEILANRGADVVFNEIERQFSMPGLKKSLGEQYENYTYPFDLDFRLEDIRRQVRLRKIDGLVHYIQSFCHRQIEDIVIREKAGAPVLAVEGDRPGPVDGRIKTRIDAFLEILGENRT